MTETSCSVDVNVVCPFVPRGKALYGCGGLPGKVLGRYWGLVGGCLT